MVDEKNRTSDYTTAIYGKTVLVAHIHVSRANAYGLAHPSSLNKEWLT
jgi:hypothetical protein